MDLSAYTDLHAAFVTITTYQRNNIFVSKLIVDEMVGRLKFVTQEQGWIVHGYCFLPDHLHLVVEPHQDTVDLIKYISKFKQLTGYYYKQKTGERLWQKSFYDHLLRKEESIIDVTRYTLENPQKDGLVNNWKDYPFLGSFVHDVNEL